ncbi:putative RNA-directed DNA polymerase from transposon X-element [Trichonephila clavipes]|nr:putative RNA-directed DNA polymerase from transposon X-element [Trichonephila clavipes]
MSFTCGRSVNDPLYILKLLSNTLWGADRVSLLRVYQALILSRLDYGCVVYGSARASVLKRLDTVHHTALRICSLVPSELRLLPACMCAELTAIIVVLQHITVSNHRRFCVYTDSMRALESLHFSTDNRHFTVIEILLLLRRLERKGFDIIFSWVPGQVGILGNEQADTVARSMSDHMQRPVCYRDLKTSTQNYIHRV